MVQIYLVFVILLQLTLNCDLTGAGSDREHVHIKVHIPEMVKKHTHIRKIYKHHFHPKKIHIPELDSSFAGGGFGSLPYYPLNFPTPEHTLHDFPSDFTSNVNGISMFPGQIPQTTSHIAAVSGDSSSSINGIDNSMMDGWTSGILKPKLKIKTPQFGGNKFYPKSSTTEKKFPMFNSFNGQNHQQFGGYDNSLMMMQLSDDENMHKTKFHVDYEDDTDDDLDDAYEDESEIKTATSIGSAMHDIYDGRTYNPESLATATTSSMVTNQFQSENLPSSYPQTAGVNANSVIKWYGDENESSDWTIAQPSTTNFFQKHNNYVMQPYLTSTSTRGNLPKRKKTRMPTEMKITDVGREGEKMPALIDNDRWIPRRKKTKQEKMRRRRPSRTVTSSQFYGMSF